MKNVLKSILILISFIDAYPQINVKDLFTDKNLCVSVSIDVPGRFPASGFYYQNKDSLFIVTAKHVILDSLNNPWAPTYKIYSPIPSNHDSLLELTVVPLVLKNNKHILFLDSIDIAITHIGKDTLNGKLLLSQGILFFSDNFDNVSLRSHILIKYNDVKIADEVFILGYPSSLGIKNHPQFNYKFPLLRKGIVAGKYNLKKTLIIDGPVYYGNSGSPVLIITKGESGYSRFAVIGIISEFIPFDEYWANRILNSTDLLQTNSGYSIAVPMDNLLKLLGEVE
jgi:hypothetical protein